MTKTAAILALAATTLFSCKKKESELSAEAQKLTSGKWNFSVITVDMNSNGIKESTDHDTTEVNHTWQFNTNGIFNEIVDGIEYGGYWQLVDNNHYIKLIEGDTIYLHIETLADKQLIVKDTSTLPGLVLWYTFAK